MTLIADKNNLNTPNVFAAFANSLRSGSSLKHISLANCHLTDTFGIPFGDALKTNKELVKFNLSGNEFTSATVKQMAFSLEEQTSGSLEEINLSSNNINDEGGVKLASALKYHRKLVKLNLSNNALTDETALAFNRNIPANKVLGDVNLTKNLVNMRVLELL